MQVCLTNSLAVAGEVAGDKSGENSPLFYKSGFCLGRQVLGKELKYNHVHVFVKKRLFISISEQNPHKKSITRFINNMVIYGDISSD